MTLYTPGNRLGKLYTSALLLIALVTTPVEGFEAVSVTPGMIPPDASVMVPLRLALLDWLNAIVERTIDSSNAVAKQYRFIVLSSFSTKPGCLSL
jgi:hypothetical protein